MGKPGSSCLKIMGCGGDPEADGGAADMEVAAAAAEDKTTLSSDKRRWSFRRRSSRHRVLNNTSISEPAANSNDAMDASSNVVSSPSSLHNLDKTATVKSVEEEPQPPSSIIVTDGKVSEDSEAAAKPIGDDDKDVSCSIEEPLVIVIQTAIRVYLARKELIKLKNIVKLQAVVRGHLVRRKAVGSLYCIQSIVKVQALIRAHLMQLGKGDRIYRYETKPIGGSNSKLLKNAFVRQLLGTAISEEIININCEPTIADSTWLWLERWTTITSEHAAEIQDLGSNDIFVKQSERPAASEVFATVEVDTSSCAVDSKPELCQIDSNGLSDGCTDLKVPSPRDKPEETFKFQEPSCNSLVSDVAFDSSTDILSSEEPSQSISSQAPSHSEGTSHPERHKRVVDLEKSKRTIKRITCEPQDTESKKITVGSKRSCNSAFAAVQSKFEELSAPATSAKLVSRPMVVAEEKRDMHPSQAATLLKCDRNSTETCIPQPRVQTAISECGTEISITSTLDSPDRSETEGGEIVMEIGDLEKRHFSPNADAIHKLSDGIDITSSEVRHSSVAIEKLEDKYNDDNGDVGPTMCNLEASKAELANSCIAENLKEQEPNKSDVDPGLLAPPIDPVVTKQCSAELTTCKLSFEHKKSIEDEVFISSISPEGSPRSHITIPESHGTPSSQVSANTEKSKATRKSRSQPHGKKSPANVTNGSYPKTSIEHLPKDPKSAKRRNSLGTAKPLPVDNQPRNSSSNALPSYMQATESARAKLMNNSIKSSPDVHDKEIYTRKRHSLPLENGKHGSSPRMQRSTSQAQQSLKGNATVSPQNSAERKWQR